MSPNNGEILDVVDRLPGGWNVSRLVTYGVVAVVVLIALATAWPFGSVPTGNRGVITQFGAIKGIEGEGLVVLWPWEKLSIFSIRAEQADIENADGSTSDTQPVKVSMTVRYSIAPDRVAEVFEKYTHTGDLSSYVQTATQEVFKAVTARFIATDLIAKRAQVSGEINQALRAKLEIYGAQVINIDMRNFSFSSSYMDAINDKVTQEQLRLAAAHGRGRAEEEGRDLRGRGVRGQGARRRRGLRQPEGRDRAGRGAQDPERGALPEPRRARAAAHRGRAHEGRALERPAAAERVCERTDPVPPGRTLSVGRWNERGARRPTAGACARSGAARACGSAPAPRSAASGRAGTGRASRACSCA
jgi:regulator of protease activity HflC (stomatin/prohibitin superfamily)